MGVAVSYILEREEVLLKTNDMTNEEKANKIAKHRESEFGEIRDINGCCYMSALDMAQWKDEQLNNLKDEIQSNLCASSGFNDGYSHGYQDCGTKVMEMIDKILNN